MAWFRFYDEVLDDPKVQRLPAETFRRWVNILCVAKRHDGVLPNITNMAFALRLSEDSVTELLKELKDFGLLDETETGMEPHNWNGRQYKSDVSTKRVKRFRKRRETVSGNAPEQSRTETETEAEKERILSSKKQFDEWWLLVPRKKGKGAAFVKFKIALTKSNNKNGALSVARSRERKNIIVKKTVR